MNGKERRALEKVIRKGGASKTEAKEYARLLYNADAIRAGGVGETTPAKQFEEGDRVKLNIDAIKARKNYERMSPGYKEFVDENADTVFTAHIEKENMISMAENPRWLFWSGDLDKAQDDTPGKV